LQFQPSELTPFLDPHMPKQPIGVFDSGVGGLSILKSLRQELPHEDFVYVSDSGYAPYGERDDSFVVERARLIAQYLQSHEHLAVKALVIACNTATAAAVHLLRQDHTTLPIIGVEPALKPAVLLSKTRRIGVMATRGTLASQKFKALKDTLAGQAEFICQACDGLADAIERDDTTNVIALCAKYTSTIGQFGLQDGQVDTLVLGCTHYPFATSHLVSLLGPDIQLVSNGEPVARQTRRMLTSLADTPNPGRCLLLTTGDLESLNAGAHRWLNLDCLVKSLTI
jgi:glutamate racemase